MYTEGEVFVPCLLSRMHDEKLILITSIQMLKLPSYKTGCQYSTVVQSDAPADATVVVIPRSCSTSREK